MTTRSSSLILRLAGFSMAALTMTATSSSSLADDTKPAPKKAAKKALAAPALQGFFRDLDANSDKVLDRQEVPESGRAAFDAVLKYADTNHDEKLQAAEYRDVLKKLKTEKATTTEPKAKASKPVTKPAEAATKPAEAATKPAEAATKPAEAAAKSETASNSASRRQGIRAKLKTMDKDGDGRISRTEFSGKPKQFDRLDTNHDGYLDREDVKKAREGKVNKAKGKSKAKS